MAVSHTRLGGYSLTLRKPSVMFLASTPAENVQLGEEQTSRCRRPGSAAVVRIVTSLSGSWQCGQLFFTSNLGIGLVMARPSPGRHPNLYRATMVSATEWLLNP